MKIVLLFCLVLAGALPAQFTVLDNNLGGAEVGVQCNKQVQFAGNTGPVVFTALQTPDWPDGLSFSPSGELSGVPVDPGTPYSVPNEPYPYWFYTALYKATDTGSSQSVTLPLALKLYPAGGAPAPGWKPPGKSNDGGSSDGGSGCMAGQNDPRYLLGAVLVALLMSAVAWRLFAR